MTNTSPYQPAEDAMDATLTGSDYNASGNQIVIAAGSTSGSIIVTAVDDEEDEADETVVVEFDSVSGGNEAEPQQQTTTITDDDDPPGFTVTSLTATASGFVAQLSTDLDAGALNLYDTQNLALGAADATLVGASSGPIRGSLIVDDSLRSVSFIKTGGPLQPDSYTVTLRSGTDAFQDVGGQLLDGNDVYATQQVIDLHSAVVSDGFDNRSNRRPSPFAESAGGG